MLRHPCILAALLASTPLVAQPGPTLNGRTTYTTGGGELIVEYSDTDVWRYHETVGHDVAYNVQIVREAPDRYHVCYHGEPRGKTFPFCGDSICWATGSDPFSMPEDRRYAIFGHFTDQESYLYSEDGTAPYSVSGGGNPMMVKVRDVYYILFLSVAHDRHPQREIDRNWRHYVHLARTVDGRSFEILNTAGEWSAFSDHAADADRRPMPLRSGDEVIRSLLPGPIRDPHECTHGQIGSLVYHRGRVHYFYTDSDWGLKCRTTTTIEDGRSWSRPVTLATGLMPGTIVRVARTFCPFTAKWRWVVAYNCYSHDNHQDIGIEYTVDDSLESLSTLHYNRIEGRHSPCTLGIRATPIIAQHFWLTDPFGTLETPDARDGGRGHGGMLTWLDHPPLGDVQATRWQVRRAPH